MQDWTRSLAVLGATGAGVTLVTLGLISVIVPEASAGPSASAAPIFDLAVAPDAIGGSLAISGDRSTTLRLDRAEGGISVIQSGDGGTTVRRGTFRLVGDDGQVVFGGDPPGVSQVDVDGLSFYLDPGDCTVTLGERNAANNLVGVLLECSELDDVRGGGTIGLEGVVAIPGDVVGERGGLPPSGGTVEAADQAATFSDAVMVGGGVLTGSSRVPLSVHGSNTESVLGLEYDPESDRLLLTFVLARGRPFGLAEPCRIGAETLGDLSQFTTVVRLTIDCPDARLSDGTSATIQGTVVVDSDVRLDLGGE